MSIHDWQANDGTLRKAIAEDRVFMHGVACWHCSTASNIAPRVISIDRKLGSYECAAGHRHAIPPAYLVVSVDGEALERIEHGVMTRRIAGSRRGGLWEDEPFTKAE